MRRVSCLPLALLPLIACAAEPPPAAPPSPPPAPVSTVVAPWMPPPAPQADGRLPRLASPKRYELSLFVDPDQPRFSGSVRILVQVAAPTQYVVLNGRGLHVASAEARLGSDLVHATTTERASHGGKDPEELVLTFDRPLTPGDAVLTLTFDGPFVDSLAGLYRVKDGGRWYAFTQFEATDARRAFPCFDEPGDKVPFDVHITTPKGLLAVSNMPETARAPHGAGATETTTFDFATTPPLPTYLVAFAVGDFDVRQGQSAPVPIRLITTKGKAGLGGQALEDTAGIVKTLGDYFHIAYPYPKLDIVAVPNFAAGAMENAGLITYREELLLLDPAHAPQRARMEVLEVIAHETAHQWFGDLVTTAWWDDIWLNEGFATWAAAKATDLYKPAYRARLQDLAALGDTMATDSLKSARAVRQPVHSTSDAMEAFDGITYQKGAAVLGMIEHFVGEPDFQKGVEAYLREHAWGSATASDLFGALSKASGQDIAALAATFVDRPGVPTVSLTVDCNAKPPTLTMTQSPWRLFGDDRTGAVSPWLIPMDVSASDKEEHALLGATFGAVPLAKCPTWVDPNVGGHGYYLYSLDEKHWAALAAVIEKQPEATRLVFLQSLWAQVRSGTLGADVLLRLLPAFDNEPSRLVLSKLVSTLGELDHAVVTPEAAPAFAAYVRARLIPHLHALDAKLAKGKGALSEDETLARQLVFGALGTLGHDPATLVDSNKLAAQWLADPVSVDGDLAQVALGLASRKAGGERLDALRAAMKAAKSPSDRQTALYALGGFDDPATLDRALGVTLTDEVPTQDMMSPLMTAFARRETRAVATQWLMAHWDAVSKRLPSEWGGYVFGVAGQACSKGEIDEMRGFLGAKSPDVEGSARPLAEGLESAELCRALRDKDSGAVDRFFKVKAK